MSTVIIFDIIRYFITLHGKDKHNGGNNPVAGLPQNTQGFLECCVAECMSMFS